MVIVIEIYKILYKLNIYKAIYFDIDLSNYGLGRDCSAKSFWWGFTRIVLYEYKRYKPDEDEIKEDESFEQDSRLEDSTAEIGYQQTV